MYNDKRHGAQALRVNVDHENGGMTLDTDFLVDFGDEPEGPALAHEVSDSETKTFRRSVILLYGMHGLQRNTSEALIVVVHYYVRLKFVLLIISTSAWS